EQGGVVVEQRRRRDNLMPAVAEVVEEATPDLGGFHSGSVLGCDEGRAGHSGVRPSASLISASRSAMAARTRSAKSWARSVIPAAESATRLPIASGVACRR